jgi:hypothetical protein
VFNPAKFGFARQEVEFAGFLITDEGIKQAWYGLVNQVTYCFCKPAVMAPFSHLLSPATEFIWMDDLDQAFVACKKKIIEMIQIGDFASDMELEMCISTDYSKHGMGLILQQKTCRCAKISATCCPNGWRLVRMQFQDVEYLLFVSIDHTVPTNSEEKFREFLEINLIEVHVRMILINNDDDAIMMLWNMIHKATQEDDHVENDGSYQAPFIPPWPSGSRWGTLL